MFNIPAAIISIIKNDSRPIPTIILANKIIKNKHRIRIDRNLVYELIEKMIERDEIRKLPNGKLVLGYENAPIKNGIEIPGILGINARGDGFTIDEKTNIKYYIHKSNIGNALRGDEVLFAPLEKESRNGLYDAKVIKVVKRNKHNYVGTVIINEDNTYSIKNDDSRMYLKVVLTNPMGLVDGTKIWYQIDRFYSDYVEAHIIKILGHKDDVGQDIESLVYDNGIDPNFPEEVLKYANNIKVELSEKDKKVRHDLTKRHIISIDPETSKDLDDAIYVEKLANGNYFLGVSIADVSIYVPNDSTINECAFERGTSVYLADRVIPMLPHKLCNDAGSLNPNVLRMCITCDMEIDKDNGNLINIDVYPAYMINKNRLTYDGVNYYYATSNKLALDSNGEATIKYDLYELTNSINKVDNNNITNPNNFSDELKNILNNAYDLHKILRKQKIKNGYVDFEIPEPKIKLNDDGFPIEIVVKKRTTAQKMIEDFMIIANEAVTLKADELNIPFLYRTHEKPDSDKLKVFNIEAKKFGFTLPSDLSDLTSKDLNRIIENNKDNPNLKMLSLLMLRSMQKAEYSTNNIGHFGLASENYTHFTSPIRRYPDLIVHRLFWMFLFTPEDYTNNEKDKLMNSLGEICEQCNITEVNSVRCEREVNSMKFAEFMTNKIGKTFDAMITTITRFGMFVELMDTKLDDGTIIPGGIIEGLVSIKDLNNDFYTYDEVNLTLVGRNTKRVYSLGKKVKVVCVGASKEERKISFALTN